MNQILTFMSAIVTSAITAIVALKVTQSNEGAQMKKFKLDFYTSERRIIQDKLQMVLQTILKVAGYYSFTSSFIDEVTKLDVANYHGRYQKHQEEMNDILSIIVVYIPNNTKLIKMVNEIFGQMNLIWGSQMNLLQSQDNNVKLGYKEDVLQNSQTLAGLINQLISEVDFLSSKIQAN